MTAALIAAIGLVFDGGEALAVKGQAISDAYGAARAGAEALDQDQFARGGPAKPNGAAAVSAASTFLSAAGVPAGQATVAVNGAVVTVTVRLTSPATILGAVGASSFRVTGSGSARAIYGLRGPQP